MRRIIIVFVLFLVFYYSIANSQTWIERMEFNDHIEGIIARPAGRPALQLVSFIHCESAVIDSFNTVFINFFCPETAKLIIEVTEISFSKGYRMEVKQRLWKKGWNVFGPWSLERAKNKYKIKPSKLGFVISYVDNDTKYLPAFISESPVNKDNISSSFSVFLMPGMTFSECSFKLFKNNTTYLSMYLGPQYDGVPFMLPPLKLQKALDYSWLKIQIILKNKEDYREVIREYEFYNP